MIDLDEDALICDFVEVYGIYDYRALPLRLVATLAAGLRDDSRIMLKAINQPVSKNTLILAMIADNLTMLRRLFGSKDDKYPPSIFNILIGVDDGSGKSNKSFASAEEFEKERQALIESMEGEQSWPEPN